MNGGDNYFEKRKARAKAGYRYDERNAMVRREGIRLEKNNGFHSKRIYDPVDNVDILYGNFEQVVLIYSNENDGNMYESNRYREIWNKVYKEKKERLDMIAVSKETLKTMINAGNTTLSHVPDPLPAIFKFEHGKLVSQIENPVAVRKTDKDRENELVDFVSFEP